MKSYCSRHSVSRIYLELSLCRAFYLVLSAFSLTSLINLFGSSDFTISNFHYVEQFSWSLQRYFALFSIRYPEHWNEVFELIILFISGIQMLITALIKLCSEVSFFFNIVQATACHQLSKNSG